MTCMIYCRICFLDLYCTDPAQDIITAGQDLDDLDDLSDLSMDDLDYLSDLSMDDLDDISDLSMDGLSVS